MAREKVARFRDRQYWAKPVPGFGDIGARILLVGLAPGAHGSNRTGRMFTGDGSGDFLYAALHAVGLASQPRAIDRDDGMVLTGVRITAVVRCAPPANTPTPAERDRCLPYVTRELRSLEDVRVIVGLGSFGWDGALRALAASGHAIPRPRPRFGHGAEVRIGPYQLVGAFHPSQQNTFTGKLTAPMLEAVLRRAQELAAVVAVGGSRTGRPAAEGEHRSHDSPGRTMGRNTRRMMHRDPRRRRLGPCPGRIVVRRWPREERAR